MATKRSKCGIVLTMIGVVVIVAGASADWWFEGARPGFHGYQMIAVAIGLLLLVIGGVVCAKCKCACAAEPAKAAAEEPPPKEPAPEAEEPPKEEPAPDEAAE